MFDLPGPVCSIKDIIEYLDDREQEALLEMELPRGRSKSTFITPWTRELNRQADNKWEFTDFKLNILRDICVYYRISEGDLFFDDMVLHLMLDEALWDRTMVNLESGKIVLHGVTKCRNAPYSLDPQWAA